MGNLVDAAARCLSPMLWNSIATGKRADKHGILGFVEPTPDGSGHPPRHAARRARPRRCGTSSARTACAATSSAGTRRTRPSRSTACACRTSSRNMPEERRASCRPCHRSPCTRRSWPRQLAELRVRPQADRPVPPRAVRPALGEIAGRRNAAVTGMQKMLAECAHGARRRHRAGRAPSPGTSPPSTSRRIDHFCHAFMQYHPPRMAHVDETKFERYKRLRGAASTASTT